MHLTGKKIILGVCGSIAAYKAALIVRLLVRGGAEVRVLMTAAAADFISPLTLSTLSRNPVYQSVHGAEGWNNHVELGLWADAMLIAPATATTLGKLANGICDNMIVAVYLSARCPVFFAPAMDVDMWHHPATQANVSRLRGYGNQLIPVEAGELASGLVGDGRLAEPETIIRRLEEFLGQVKDLAGRNILLTAGPTREALDPVRYLSNHSTGSMGLELARAAAARGAAVTLVMGPAERRPEAAALPGVTLLRITDAREMQAAAEAHWPAAHAAILTAAVADYRPAEVATEKIKKSGEGLQLDLVRNPDIATGLGRTKRPDQVLVGFALETNDEVVNARAKLTRKNLDVIVLNSLRDSGAGFGAGTNKITLIDHNTERAFELKTKAEVAHDILDDLARRLG